jgi:hypothetical protein
VEDAGAWVGETGLTGFSGLQDFAGGGGGAVTGALVLKVEGVKGGNRRRAEGLGRSQRDWFVLSIYGQD